MLWLCWLDFLDLDGHAFKPLQEANLKDSIELLFVLNPGKIIDVARRYGSRQKKTNVVDVGR
jgi:hypothetical protein